jgi:2'-5' RNA ligase
VAEQSAALAPSHLRNHWDWRPEWTPDRACLMWYLTFENQPELTALVTALQSPLTGIPALDLVPPAWVHLTVDQVGYVDSVPPEDVSAVTQSVRGALRGWSAEPLTVGPAYTMRSAVALAVAGVDGLYDRVHAATTAALGLDPTEEFRPFRAHVSLAYANRPSVARAVLDRLGDTADRQVVLGTPRLVLASVTRRDRHYQWTTREQLAL